MVNNKRIQQCLLVIAAFIFGINNAHQAIAQEQAGSKGIRAIDVVERPTSPSRKAVPAKNRARRRRPQSSESQRSRTYSSSQKYLRNRPARGMEYAKVGVTIWRLQGDGSKGFEQVGEEAQTLEQVEASTQLTIGSNLRLGIEPLTRDGYLYVIDREQFADNIYGPPRLIFPTLRTRKGNNFVRKNERVLIPRRPSYFRINPSSTGKTQVAEVLTIILSPTRLLLPAALSENVMMLSTEQFKEWETKWLAPVNKLEMEYGAGKTTNAKDLGQAGEEAQQLTDEDPLPQTVYRTVIKKGNPLLVTVPLRFEAIAASSLKNQQ